MGASITPKCITYLSGYKYQLTKDYSIATGIIPPKPINTAHIRLYKSGLLTLKEGYAWDGPSGPTFDTKNFMRGSLVHDALYQLMRDGCIGPENLEPADRLLQSICIEDGMSPLRAWWVYQAVRRHGANHLAPRTPVCAPKDCKDCN